MNVEFKKLGINQNVKDDDALCILYVTTVFVFDVRFPNFVLLLISLHHFSHRVFKFTAISLSQGNMDCNLVVQLTLQNERLKDLCQKMENLQTAEKIGEAEKVNQVLIAKDSLNVSKDLLATCGKMADKMDRVLERLCKFDEHIEKVGSHLQQFGNALQHLSTLASSTATRLQTGVPAKASNFHLPTNNAKPPSHEKSVVLEDLSRKEFSFTLKECYLQSEKAPPNSEAVLKKMPILPVECKSPVKEVIGQGDSLTSTKISPGNEDVSSGEDEPDIYFEPVIALPDLVDLKTGEEGEEVLFQDRVKLYRFDFDLKEYKERGVGELKILRSGDTGKLRLVMRREHVHKLAANHYIDADFELKPKGLRSYCWQCLDFSDGEMKPTTLAALFTSSDAANEFKLTIEKQLGKIRKETSNPVKVVEVSQPKPFSPVKNEQMPVKEEKKSAIGDVDFIFGKSSADEKQRSVLGGGQSKTESLQSNNLSSAFFTFSSLSTTKSAEENNKMPNADAQVKFNFPQPKLTTGFSLKPETFNFKTENFDMNSMKKTSDANLASNQVNNDQADAASKSLFFGFGLGQAKSDISSKENAFSLKMQNGDKSSLLDSKSWGFGALAALNQAGSWLSTTKKEETNDDGSIKNKQNDEDAETEKHSYSANDSIEEECDFVFKPVIPLPDKVDVVTGEENDELILKQRCKLYRYASDLKEYKERGAGDLKLLRNKRTGKYRLVMRQEKVLKVVVNHYVTKQMKIQISERNDRLCIWQCRNFVDNELIEETLAAKFKNVEAVKDFMEAIHQAKLLTADSEPDLEAERDEDLNNGTDSCLLDKLKPDLQCWRCVTCLELNQPNVLACVCCHTVRDDIDVENELREEEEEEDEEEIEEQKGQQNEWKNAMMHTRELTK
ncbi:RANBP2-like and GRIP domain-containing protein 1 [Trichinella spiralis]|uniref:RANBP2-like and GRIP domain-containing protein 1 n=1 Tax=Trichinella spiralis TaxID=6334 RepID=A0A0V1BTK4_TRISP|nr:RANBP2-like and GRIP domain-containing protein 1 [Trichinella spiralis]KRY40267.1 RANBP2-like and GRIP domain-containing protein 1 [Trichinella spiralis]